MKRIMILWAILGALYVNCELLWRGFTHPSMIIVGGLCGVLVGATNQHPKFYGLPIYLQSIIGAAIVVGVEFVSGCVLNLWLGLGVWDYSGQPGNILGQVCPLYAAIWLLLLPFAIWAEDTASWLLAAWDKAMERPYIRPRFEPYSLCSVYVAFFTGK